MASERNHACSRDEMLAFGDVDSANIDLSVVIPAYRSAASLSTLVSRLRSVLGRTERSYEIVIVDDGSPDNTWEVLRELQANYPECVVTIRLMRNFGQHNALMCGFRHAGGRYVVTMDDDLQNPPEEIPKLLEYIEESGHDLVYGKYEAKKHSLWRNMGSCVIRRLYRFAFNCPVDITSFRIARRELVVAILHYDLNYTIVDGLLAWNTQRIGAITVCHHARQHGRSAYRLRRLLVHAMSAVTNFSLMPLQIAGAIGLISAIGGLVTGMYFLIQYMLSSITVPGYASTIVAIMVLGGIQLVSLGIIGEYLGRVHFNINRKPQYTVREIRKLSHTVSATGLKEVPTDDGRRCPAIRSSP